MEEISRSLHELLSASFGVRTTYKTNPVVGQVEITPTRILALNPKRLGFVITNTGAGFIYLSPGNEAVSATNGIVLPGTGSISLSWDKDFSLCSEDWWAIAAVAPRTIHIVEIVSY